MRAVPEPGQGATGPPPLPALRLKGVSKRFGERSIVQSIDLTLQRGERVALLGESGVGKSTLLNLVAGLETPDAGTVEVDGVRIDTLDDGARARLRRTALGFVFQAFHLLPHLTVAQNVAVPLLLAGRDRRAAVAEAAAMLAELGVAAQADAWPGTLSGGEQQRVALARALVHRPAIVLADEPTGNLDPVTARAVLALLFARCEAAGATLLMVTHSTEAAALAQRRLRLTTTGLHDDRVAASGVTR